MFEVKDIQLRGNSTGAGDVSSLGLFSESAYITHTCQIYGPQKIVDRLPAQEYYQYLNHALVASFWLFEMMR